MRYWLGAVAAVSAAVVVAFLLPDARNDSRPEPSAEELRYMELWTEVTHAHGMLQARRWSDSLSALTVRTAEAGLALGTPTLERVTPEGMTEWRQIHEAQLAALQPRDPEMLVGFFLQPIRHGALQNVPTFATGSRRQTYAGTRDGSAYCLQVEPLPPGTAMFYRVDNADLRSPLGTSLGACRLYAKYGVPGPQVNAWLEAGGLELAYDASTDAPTERLLGPRAGLPLPFGLNRPFSEHVAVARCLADDGASCAQAVTDPEVLAAKSSATRGDPAWLAANTPISHVADPHGALTSFKQRSASLLADLEAEFGPDAFARFWTSDEAVPEAFAAAFGMDLGEWVLGWSDDEIGHFRAGPSPTAATLGWSVLTLMLLTGFAGLKQVRRRVA
jgi:hypothetical protein